MRAIWCHVTILFEVKGGDPVPYWTVDTVSIFRELHVTLLVNCAAEIGKLEGGGEAARLFIVYLYR